jgi:hypothetical protein
MRLEKILIFIIIIAVVITLAFVVYLFSAKVLKGISVSFPSGGEELRVGETYKISWSSRGIDKVGIVLFKGQTPKWLAKDIDASEREYEWKIYPGQEYGDDFWVAVVEFPWQERNQVAFSDGSFAIAYPTYNSCDSVSIENQWPYVPSDLPNVRRIFITETAYTGNLGGIEGADIKCQEEARKLGYTGVWRAFIGGDSAQELAGERLKKTPRQLRGIFVEAKPGARLFNGINCYALLGKDFNEFLTNFSNLTEINKRKFTPAFFNDFGSIWLGRIDQQSKSNCITKNDISFSSGGDSEKTGEFYSYTSTCQRWTNGSAFVTGYSGTGQGGSFPTCYTPQGRAISAFGVAGLSSGIKGEGEAKSRFTAYEGKSCDARQKLLCVEE